MSEWISVKDAKKDYIERTKVFEIINYMKNKYERDCTSQFWLDTMRYLGKKVRGIPSSKVTEVVRCKECINAIFNFPISDRIIPEIEVSCSCGQNPYDKNFYCGYGRRREP